MDFLFVLNGKKTWARIEVRGDENLSFLGKYRLVVTVKYADDVWLRRRVAQETERFALHNT